MSSEVATATYDVWSKQESHVIHRPWCFINGTQFPPGKLENIEATYSAVKHGRTFDLYSKFGLLPLTYWSFCSFPISWTFYIGVSCDVFDTNSDRGRMKPPTTLVEMQYLPTGREISERRRRLCSKEVSIRPQLQRLEFQKVIYVVYTTTIRERGHFIVSPDWVVRYDIYWDPKGEQWYWLGF